MRFYSSIGRGASLTALLAVIIGGTFILQARTATAGAPLPDLVSFNTGPAPEFFGQIITFESGVRNIGDAPADNVVMRFKLQGVKHNLKLMPAECTSSAGPVTTSRVVNCPLGTLNPGELKTLAFTVKQLGGGFIIVTTIADPKNVVAESNKGNNTFTGGSIVIAEANLLADAQTHGSDTDVDAGEDAFIIYHIQNEGPSLAEDIVVDIRITNGLPVRIRGGTVSIEFGTCQVVSDTNVKCYIPRLAGQFTPGDANVDISFRVRAAADVAEGAELEGSITATVSASGASGELDFSDNVGVAPLTVHGPDF